MSEDKSDVQTFYFASIGRRFISAIIDSILVGLVFGLLFRIGPSLLENVFTFVYTTVMLSQFKGQTIGMRTMKIKAVNYDGSIPSVQTALIRTLVSYISGLVIGIGYIWALFNAKKQTWHDLAARTYIVEE